MKTKLLIVFSFISAINFAQEVPPKEEQLDEIIVSASRIEIPFSKDSRTITVITSKEIQKSAALTVSDILKQVAGVDVRSRGAYGTQADLYIRGGGFDQTLLLIDGIKVDDSQTGHHTLNMALPLDVIERIEIIKGPAARIYGQNAFTGAINIITKKKASAFVSVGARGGSNQSLSGEVTANTNFENSSHLVHYSRNTSKGYRYNTDYDTQNYFLKSTINSEIIPFEILATHSERKFGANGFYATASAKDQYEETQTSLIGFSSQFKIANLKLSPRLYWRRNQDKYVFLRHDPSVYRNLHITNKIGAEINASYTSNIGVSGFGVDIAKVFIASNNLGNHNRFMTTLFLEHRFQFLNNKLDVTPGIAATYFSDFKLHAFPGVDIGYAFSKQWKIYANAGYTYRIPTYTDLYYSDPTSLGNENLAPEEAISEEIGIKFHQKKININIALFNRDSKNLIDYVKNIETNPFVATNIRTLNTKGFEANLDYQFSFAGYTQFLKTGYTFINDEVKSLDINFSRYAINSLKHQVTGSFRSQFLKNLSQTLVYKYAEKTAGESYSIVDASAIFQVVKFEISVTAQNIFNKEYTETNLVPMPKGNLIFGLKYTFD
ncbi:TonB-dependent receptor [Aequorivita sp. Q41]|uniref:TonB-dependent receptor plug domain-containing protein n=1 Tax=Aequorivita sp. Q41 TaxID=3153300 RepID=UPI003242D9C4